MKAPPPPQKLPKKIMEDPELRDFFLAMVKSNFYVWKKIGVNLEINEDVGMFGADPVDQASAMTDALTSITHTAPGSDDFVIQDLVQSDAPTAGEGFGFATKDEGNTVLKTIANLQARVKELEAGLDSSTGIGVFS